MKIGILSDIHEDLDSLTAAMDIFERERCDELICLGDILGYEESFYPNVKNRNASECIALVKSNFKYVVVGNHDLFAIRKLPGGLDGMTYPEDWYDLSISRRRELSRGKLWLYESEKLEKPLSADEEEFIRRLPEYIVVEINGLKLSLSHSVYPDFTGSYFFRLHDPWELRRHFTFMKSSGASVGFSGHMHSKNLLKITRTRLDRTPYGKRESMAEFTHFISPGIARGRGKSGLIIADINTSSIQAIEINNRFKQKLMMFYGKN